MAGDRPSWRAEFGLALECCKWGFRGRPEPIRHVPAETDWSRFLEVVGFHRVEGLAAAFLGENDTDAPPEVLATLSSAAAKIAARNLEAAADCRALLNSFETAGVPLLFVKGLTLGRLAYRDPSVKAAIDIDLLIDRTDLHRAAALLRGCGYRLTAPGESPGDEILTAWHRGWKESVWTKAQPRLQIDLHTRLTDNKRLIPGIDVHSPRQWVDIGNGIQLPTLAEEECFAYVAVHGAWSAWFRLKWISDFAGLLHGRPGDEINRLYRRSLELGGARSAGQALLLADALFGILAQSPQLKHVLMNDRAIRHLCRAALRLLTREPLEPTATRLGSLPIRRTQFFLSPGLGFKLSELSGQAYRTVHRPPR